MRLYCEHLNYALDIKSVGLLYALNAKMIATNTGARAHIDSIQHRPSRKNCDMGLHANIVIVAKPRSTISYYYAVSFCRGREYQFPRGPGVLGPGHPEEGGLAF